MTDVQALLAKGKELLKQSPSQFNNRDKFAFSRLKPTGSVERKAAGFFSYETKLTKYFPGDSGKAFEGMFAVHNFEGVSWRADVLHRYAPVGNLEGDFLIILHTHDKDQYCPWGQGCHVQVSKEFYVKHLQPLRWFNEIWEGYYECSSDVLQ